MKYLLIILVAILALTVICGAVGLLAYGWFAITNSGSSLPPAPVDSNFGHLPTPTLASGDGNLVIPPPQPTIDPAAPPAADLPAPSAPFDGTFAGTLSSSDNSTAPVTLELTQNSTAVSGNIHIAEGLSLDGGVCGAQAVPALTQQANGQTEPANPNRLNAAATFEVQGMAITLNLAAEAAADGRTMTAQARIDLPFPCTDPLINGTFVRQ